MIRLSTKGRYGTRLMLNLARHYLEGKDAIILKDISKEEDISIRYLEQIIIPLRINKLVKSIRGAGGGYTLTRPPAEIKMREILEVLEGTCCLVDCVEDETYCDRFPTCASRDLWREASYLLKNYFESMTLMDLVDMHNKKNPQPKRQQRKAS